MSARLRSPAPAAWWELAACAAPGVNLALFFPERGQHGRAAKRICHRCPVEAVCLAEALATPSEQDQGIRGGTTREERRRLRRRAR